jgi:hypothetical protein
MGLYDHILEIRLHVIEIEIYFQCIYMVSGSVLLH